jgi:hypothetical protein
VSFFTVVSVAVACYEASTLMVGMIVVLTFLAQSSNVPNTCCVLVICFLSTSGVLLGGGVS